MHLRASAETEFFDPAHFPKGSKVLDVGCGETKKVPWAVGIDRVKTAAADVVHDLDVFPWPFPDNSFDGVVAAHVVEHVADVLKLFDELHRICRAGAQVRVATPHYTSPDAFADPTTATRWPIARMNSWPSLRTQATPRCSGSWAELSAE